MKKILMIIFILTTILSCTNQSNEELKQTEPNIVTESLNDDLAPDNGFLEDTETKKSLFRVIITASVLNVRTGPSQNHAIAGALRIGEIVNVQEVSQNSEKIDGISGQWYLIDSNTVDGYIFSGYTLSDRDLSLKADTESSVPFSYAVLNRKFEYEDRNWYQYFGSVHDMLMDKYPEFFEETGEILTISTSRESMIFESNRDDQSTFVSYKIIDVIENNGLILTAFFREGGRFYYIDTVNSKSTPISSNYYFDWGEYIVFYGSGDSYLNAPGVLIISKNSGDVVFENTKSAYRVEENAQGQCVITYNLFPNEMNAGAHFVEIFSKDNGNISQVGNSIVIEPVIEAPEISLPPNMELQDLADRLYDYWQTYFSENFDDVTYNEVNNPTYYKNENIKSGLHMIVSNNSIDLGDNIFIGMGIADLITILGRPQREEQNKLVYVLWELDNRRPYIISIITEGEKIAQLEFEIIK